MILRHGGPGPPGLVTFVTFFLCFFVILTSNGLVEADKSKSFNKKFFSQEKVRHCLDCDVCVSNGCWTSHLKSNAHKLKACKFSESGIEILNSAFQCRIISYKISSSKHFVELQEFQENVQNMVVKVIQHELKKHNVIKINLELFGLYYLPHSRTSEIKSHNTVFEVVTQSTNLIMVYEKLMGIIHGKFDEFAERDSDSMQTLCKNHFLQQLYRKIDGAVLWSQNERNLDCVITFQTHSILQRFMLRFDGLQLDCNDHLFIYDGAHAVGTYKFDLSCKNTKQTLGAMFTRTNYVTLKYVTDNWGTDMNGFKLVITAVKDPKHACTEFRCNLREFCIATDLVCDGINHCADGSDESSNNLCQNNDTGTILGLEVTWFVVVVISALLVLLVLIVAVSVCVCRRGGWNNRHGNSVQQQNASYSLARIYGSNGHVVKPTSGSTTTLADGNPTTVPSGNWRRPAGPPGFRTPPARDRPYCPAG